MKVLDVFSGTGGFSLGLERAGKKTAAFCETDEFCQKVLEKRFPNKVDRNRALGNAAVPHVAELIGRGIMKVEQDQLRKERGGHERTRA